MEAEGAERRHLENLQRRTKLKLKLEAEEKARLEEEAFRKRLEQIEFQRFGKDKTSTRKRTTSKEDKLPFSPDSLQGVSEATGKPSPSLRSVKLKGKEGGLLASVVLTATASDRSPSIPPSSPRSPALKQVVASSTALDLGEAHEDLSPPSPLEESERVSPNELMFQTASQKLERHIREGEQGLWRPPELGTEVQVGAAARPRFLGLLRGSGADMPAKEERRQERELRGKLKTRVGWHAFVDSCDDELVLPLPILASRRGLKSLDLSNYGMGDRLANALAKAICGSDLPLTCLQISNNRLSVKGSKLLLQALEASDEIHASLVDLDISKNKIGVDGNPNPYTSHLSPHTSNTLHTQAPKSPPLQS